MDDFKCPHCGYTYDPYDGYELAGSQTIEVFDNAVCTTADYQCPNCRGITRGTQRGEIVHWQDTEFEAV